MEGAGLFRVNDVSLMEEIMVSELCGANQKEQVGTFAVPGGGGPAHRRVESNGFEVEWRSKGTR